MEKEELAHLDDQDLRDLVKGDLSEWMTRYAEEHMRRCSECKERYQRMKEEE